MAGNLVKWWKHKILGGYKQFSVQECTTDSEELMYHQVRASSSCSAPPDLLLVSDRENNIPLRSPVVNIIGATIAPTTTTTSPSSGINACHITSVANNNQQRHNQKLQQQQQQQNPHVTTQQLSLGYNNGTKDTSGCSNVGRHQKQSGISSSNKHGQQQQTQDLQQASASHDVMEGQLETQTHNYSATKQSHHNQQHQQQFHHNQHHHQQQQQRSEEHIRLEEFTCDVSVEGGKSSQPLQFSFTFYDLDGHHGKITKDDIVGIVYTIYESIGKSVVVPHSGSKTINVRLTVSPEGKSKSSKNKKVSTGTSLPDHTNPSNQKASALASNPQSARRLNRYKPRKLINSDEEDDDSNSDKEHDNNVTANNLSHVLAHKRNQKQNKLKTDEHCCTQQQSLSHQSAPSDLPNSPLDTIYDNYKASSPPEACRECLGTVDESRNTAISPLVTTTAQFPAASKAITTTTTTNEAYMKHVASTRIKMLRKSRKQKHQDCLETRQRSLSVGNETCWKNRHLQKQSTQQQLLWHAEQHLSNGADVVDGVQLRNPLKSGKTAMVAQKRNSAECWKTALNRNDLISIIRESMEKNRLCFQLNGKPQANVSPIRHSQQQQQQQIHHQQHQPQHYQTANNKQSQQHQATVISSQRQRSNTVSKIPTLIANHNNIHSVSPQHQFSSAQNRSSSCANTINYINNNNSSQHDTSMYEHHSNTNSSNNIYHHHLQPHIPIYHQQMAINPAVIAAQTALLTASTSGAVASAGGSHVKMNLCGYDSFLHATICGGGLSHSPPPAPPQPSTKTTSQNFQVTSPSALVTTTAISGHHHQQIATVQPIMSQNSNKHMGLAVTPNQIKTSKILRSGSYTAQSQSQHHQHSTSNTTQNSPQYHGYHRLPSSSKHNISALHLVSPSIEKPQLDQLDKWRRDQVKNYDQLLYAKLSEKLQQTNLISSNNHGRESNQKRKHRVLRQRCADALAQEGNNVSVASTVLTNTICVKEDSDYATMIPVVGDPVECENLLGQTSDEETHSQLEASSLKAKEDLTACKQQARHIAEGTLVDLDDLSNEKEVQTFKHAVNADILLRVDNEVHNLQHLDDDLEIDEDLEGDLVGDLEEVGGGVVESGRNSGGASSASSNVAATATLANTNAANTSTTSSSLIHRYVHEHIHHHYHHFEEKEE